MKKFISLVLLLALVIGCGPKSSNDSINATESYIRYDLKQTDTDALWTFNGLLGGLRSKVNYILEGVFLEAQSEWTLHSHFNGFNLRDGVQINAKRNDKILTFSFSTPQFPPRTMIMDQPFETDVGDFRYRIEVHNGAVDGARILVWKDWLSLQGEIVTQKTPITAGNADYDSRKAGGYFLSSGRGVHWGLEFTKVKMGRALREAAYVQ